MSKDVFQEFADNSGNLQNPYYDEWKKVESESLRLGLIYSQYSRLLFTPGISEEKKKACFEEQRKVNHWVFKFTRKYAWAIPNNTALQKIADYAPLVEIGAGTGYWAWLLRQLGVDILAFDRYPPDQRGLSKNKFHPQADTFTEILSGDESVLDSMDNRSLFLCWPPYDHPMAFQTLSRFRGNNFLFIGEGWPHRTNGDKHFFDLLHLEWTFEEDSGKIAIPQWPGRKDFLWIYRRKL